MKKFILLILLNTFVFTFVSPVLAQDLKTCEEVTPPVWSDYVPKKYVNPRPFKKGKSIGELSAGIFLTDLILTAPIGIPMIVHSSTKLKHNGYYERKIKFEEGLIEAEKIKDPAEKKIFYDKLLKDCKLSAVDKEKHDKKLEKKRQKELKKELKKQKKEEAKKEKIKKEIDDKNT